MIESMAGSEVHKSATKLVKKAKKSRVVTANKGDPKNFPRCAFNAASTGTPIPAASMMSADIL